jgi:dipeptidyl aminopeptidase/acylaminoacyl peptidase
MPSRPKSKPALLAFLVLCAALALPASAGATLAYVKNPLHPVVFAAGEDGSGAHRVAAGRNPRVSPDGHWIAYLHEGPKHAQELKLAPAGGGAGRTLMVGWRESFYLAFSPDSASIAALKGPQLGKVALTVVDLASGRQTQLATGYFSGFSFSPDGTRLAYSRSASEAYPPRSDVFAIDAPVPGKVYVQAPQPTALTKDHRSQDPLWGPDGRIAFVKSLDAKKRQYGPKNELYLMDEAGRHVKRLTHTKVPPLLQGLFPTAWSANGSRLLAEFEGQDVSYAVAVNPKTGAQRPVAKTGEAGFVGTALAADGSAVLGFTGGFEPGPKHDVVAVPYSGGNPRILAKGAYEPDWSR